MRRAVLRGLALASLLLALLAPTARASTDGFTISSGSGSQAYLRYLTLPGGSTGLVHTCSTTLPWSSTIGGGTQWISPSADCTAGAAAGNYVYTMFFTVTPGASNILLSGAVKADNSVTITLNGTPVPLTPVNSDPTVPTTYTFQATSGFYTSNTTANTLTFTVNNNSVSPTGLDFHWGVSWTSYGAGGPPTGLLLMPISKDQCEKGGWQDFPPFKNQGRCASFVEHQK
jgi:hypothetical protein